ncbi:MAG TPA: CopD family protein [Hyphomicrobiales bacterium]|nr:CopD family protein [Hyphomicrobiales bacterium]
MLRRLGRAAVILAALSWAPAALAHAALVGAEPADGAIVAAAPRQLVLTFDEPVAPITLSLSGKGDKGAALTDWRRQGNAIVITPPGAIAPGTHALSWRVVSLDGHPVGGAVVFSVGAPSARPPAAEAAATPTPVDAAIWLTRLVLYLGLFVGAGGAFFRASTAGGRLPRAAERAVAGAAAAGLAAVVLSVGLQGLDAYARPLAALGSAMVWREGIANAYGVTAAIAAAALVLALASLGVGSARRILAGLALLGVGLALAASGHASAATPQALTRPAVFLHATALAWWLGALVPLAFLVGMRDPAHLPALMRFSRRAPYAVAIVAACGIALAVVQIGSLAAIPATAYGRLFAAKLALVLALLALAAWNRWRLTPALVAGQAGAAPAMVRSVVAETVVAALILGVVAGWRLTPPPRALAAAAEAPATLDLEAPAGMAMLTLTPGRAGPIAIAVALMAPNGQPLAAKGVTLVLSDPTAGIGPIRRAAVAAGPAQWRVAGLVVPAAGTWHVHLDILIDDFTALPLDGKVALR